MWCVVRVVRCACGECGVVCGECGVMCDARDVLYGVWSYVCDCEFTCILWFN